MAVQTDPAGNQIIHWEHKTESCEYQVVTSRAPGGTLAESQVPCGYSFAVSPVGEVFAYAATGGEVDVFAAPAGQQLPTTPTVVKTFGPSQSENEVRIAFSPNGVPTIFLGNQDPSNFYVVEDLEAATRLPDGDWDLQAIDPSFLINRRPYFAIAADGSAVALWRHEDRSDPTTVYGLDYSRREAGATTWSAPAALVPSSSNDVNPEALQVNPTGGFTAIYSTDFAALDAVDMDASGTWSAVQPLTLVSGYVPLFGSLAFDSQGDAVAAWGEHYTSGGTIGYAFRAFSRPADSMTWNDGGTDLTTERTQDPRVSFDASDAAIVHANVNGERHIWVRPPGSSVFTETSGPPDSGAAAAPSLSTDSAGHETATWADASGAVYESVYDPVAPTIDHFTAPTAPVAGQPASFDISGSDLYGPVTYSVDFGDGLTANGRVLSHSRALLARTNSGTLQHTYAQPGTYNSVMTVTDGAANSTSTNRAVTVGAATPTVASPGVQSTPSAGPGASPAQAPAPLPPIAGLPDPVVGATANAFPIQAPVLIKQPGQSKFVPLIKPEQVKVGSIIDATKGIVRLTIMNARGKLDTADFYGGVFKLLQGKIGSKFATLLLTGGAFAGCPRAPKAVLSRKRLSPARSVRHLWGSGTGAFRTVGRFSSASVRGTKWLTDDRCNGTLTRVTQGKIAVSDFVKRKTIVIRAGHKYFARPKKR
ncbi:MAG: hypothetical protein QOJ29_4642 [Thermoleophilaceae bacterium]|nr:hypothetical protein [Thermoleophilaceae bacterium]